MRLIQSGFSVAVIMASLLVTDLTASEVIGVKSAVVPVYPTLAHKAHHEADMKAQVKVTPSGSVSDVVIVESNALFDYAVIGAVKQWRFTADSSERTVEVKFSFRLLPRDAEEHELGVTLDLPGQVEVREKLPPKLESYP